nr:asparagine synthase-related protein [Rhodanobacter glycinis]
MLKMDVAWADLSQVPKWESGTIVVGNGSLAPYPHPALETLLVRTDGRWFVVVRERRAGNEGEGRMSAQDVTSERFEQLHRASLLWPLDYVMVEAAEQGCRVKLRAGVLGSAPVYCRATGERLHVSWDFADFLAEKLPIDFEVASCSLALEQTYSARQLCVGVHLLTERATFHLEPGRAQYRYPATFQLPAHGNLQEMFDVVGAFDQHLRRVLEARPMSAARISVELSGGMDSAAVACALAADYGSVMSYGVLVSGECRAAQIERREKIVAVLGLSDETADIDELPPSLDLGLTERPSYVNTEYYLEAFESLWQRAHAQGCDSVFSGLGGDELFMGSSAHGMDGAGIGDPTLAESRSSASRLLTRKAAVAAHSLRAFDAPTGPVPSVMASASRAHHLMQHGLWPINPLSDPALMVFCHQLPPEYRRKRSLIHRYLSAGLGKDVFPPQYAKETFAHVFPRLIARHRGGIARQLRECALSDAGLVERDAVLSLLDEVAISQSPALAAPLVNFIWLERFARRLL